MKTSIFTEKAEPVPARVKGIAVLACIFLLGISIAAGVASAPDSDIPVVLANGQVITPPWYITIDGKNTALLGSKEEAEEVVEQVVEKYRSDPETILDIRIVEDTELEKMEITNGDEPPDISTVEEAKDMLLRGDGGKGLLTVEVTREEAEVDIVECEEEYKPEPSMYVGQTKVETEGSSGVKKTTKRTVSENGQQVQEEIVEEEMIKEPTNLVVLTGTKNYDGYGGGNAVSDEGVSFDNNVTYNTLRTPVDDVHITSYFGPRWGTIHYGIDMGLAEGSDIYAADGGTVYCSSYCGGYGNLVKIDHGNGMQTYYAHCSKLLVTDGQEVEAGERIALVGSTGNSTGPHLHFEVIINGVRIDPLDFLDLQ